jgi:hypothetical protein
MSDHVDVSKEVKSLVEKAEQAQTADDALKFSQAACNSANAMAALANAKKSIV